MNKLLTYAGTQPIYLGDIDFVQNAASDVFKNIAKALMNLSSDTLNAVLQGVELSRPSSGTIAWTAGVVVLNGEILPIEAGSITADSEDELYLQVVSTRSGDRTFKDGVSRQCYDTRSATISLAGVTLLTSLERLHPLDYVSYEPVSQSNSVTAARLVYKNGLFFIEASFNITEVNSFIAQIYFKIDESLFASVRNVYKFDNLFLYTTEEVASIVTVAFGKVSGASDRNVVVEFNFSSTPIMGNGSYKEMLPLF